MPNKTVLVANRGEIALRIIRTAKQLGYRTVSVYSDADRESPHVNAADAAYALRGVSAQESYLDVDKILQAAKATAASLVHPGYGFLSEKASFASATERAGLLFVGPSAYTLEVLGQKHSAMELAKNAGVPTIPSVLLRTTSSRELSTAAKKLGFPLMVKACLGGGGKGMRLVTAEIHLKDAAAAAKREALSYFANGELMLEKVLTKVQHIEVQVARDTKGNTCHIFERECSVQRRNQKVIEECPAAGLSGQVRQSLFGSAIKLAAASKLTGIATVEFLVDEHGNYFFLEVNPRLQVEHPVTELVTGLDLVELQFLIAEGEELPEHYRNASVSGHAVEARVYAEVPEREFVPSSGQIKLLRLPSATAQLRLEHALFNGMRIGTSYDPMLAKIIAHGETRDEALQTLVAALSETVVVGVDNNIPYLQRVALHPQFVTGRTHTKFLEAKTQELQTKVNKLDLSLAAATYVLVARSLALAIPDNAFSPLCNWRSANIQRPTPIEESWCLECLPLQIKEDVKISLLLLEKTTSDEIAVSAVVNGTVFNARWSAGREHLSFGGQSYSAKSSVARQAWIFGDDLAFSFAGYNFQATALRKEKPGITRAESRSTAVLSPLPGLVLAMKTAVGKSVKKGETLLIIESMKMEHNIAAPRDCTIAKILIKNGQSVGLGQALIQLKD